MSSPNSPHPRPARRAGGRDVGLAFAAVPAAAQAAPVNLATASPFVALAGSTVTNTGPSVLNGDLGVAPGTALVGFGLPAVVNGATHDNDAVAAQAQSDLTTAYDVAAGQPVLPANDLTGTDLGNRTLKAGGVPLHVVGPAHRPAHARRRGRPERAVRVRDRLDADDRLGQLGRARSTAPRRATCTGRSAARRRSAATTAFAGQRDGAHLASRSTTAVHVLRAGARAQRPAVSLINNVLDGSMCGTSRSAPPGSTGSSGSGSAPNGQAAAGQQVDHTDPQRHRDPAPRAARPAVPRARAAARRLRRRLPRDGQGPHDQDASSSASTASASLAAPARRSRSTSALGPAATPSARSVTFKDATRAKTLKLGYRACAAAVLQPASRPVAVHRMSHAAVAAPRPLGSAERSRRQ